MFVTKTIADAGNAAIVACNESNEAEQKTLELRSAAVAAIQAFNAQLAVFLGLRAHALTAIKANSTTSDDLASAHANDLLPAAIPDPDEPADQVDHKITAGDNI